MHRLHRHSRKIFLLLILFILAWILLTQTELPFTDWISSLREDKLAGLMLYSGLTIAATVVAPLATVALTPLAANLWGWQWVMFLSVLAWQIGALVNFWIARRWGRRLLAKFIDLKKLDSLVEHFPHGKQFVTTLLLRMIVPVDILSYALGFTQISFLVYFWATLLGITPFAFIMSYGGSVMNSWEIIPILSSAILLFYIVSRYTHQIIKKT